VVGENALWNPLACSAAAMETILEKRGGSIAVSAIVFD
jgi:hypothetical protein